MVQPRDTRDVQAVVRWANRFGVRLVARSGGHSYAGYSTSSQGVVVDLGRMRGVRVAGGRATVGPGAQLIDLYAPSSRRGLLVPGGSCPSVGVGGLALGGGHGLSGRRFGLTSDNLRAATVVTADGRARRVSRQAGEDLFWACRGGGGGNFGIVTSLAFATHRAAGGSWFFVSWPWSQAAEALAAWQAFAPEAPPALTSIFSLGTSGGSGSPRVTALGQHFGSESALRRLIRPLARVDGAQVSSGSASMMGLNLRWAGCLDDGFRACHTRGTRAGGTLPRASFLAKSDYFDRPLPPTARRRMVAWVERRQRTPSLGSGALLLDAYGGAYNGPRRTRRRSSTATRSSRSSTTPHSARGGGRDPRLDPGRVARPQAVRVRRGLPELHRPAAGELAAGLLRREPRPAARGQAPLRPGLSLSLSPGDSAGGLTSSSAS